MDKFKEGDEVYTASFEINKRVIKGIDNVGVDKYWLDDMFGYFSSSGLFKTKIEAIDRLIDTLEQMKVTNT